MVWPGFIRHSIAVLALLVACPALADEVVDLRLRVTASSLQATTADGLARELASHFGYRVDPVVGDRQREAIARRMMAGVPRRDPRAASALEDLSRWVRVGVPSDQLDSFLAAISTDARIDRYEEVPLARTSALVPDDPLLTSQQGWLDQVHLPEAWASVSGPGAASVRVAIVDGGTEWTHPDLLDNVEINAGEIPSDGIDQDGNGFVDDEVGWCFARDDGDPSPLAGQRFNGRHGTHVAGIVGAVLGNGVGVAGAGGNPRLILINAAHPTIDGGIAFGYEGILYAVARGADVINCSWRTARVAGSLLFDAPYSEFEALVLRVARESGALVVAAVGNDSAEGLWTTPAGYEDALSVTATGRSSPELWGASNTGPWIDIAAPGEGMISTFPADQAGTEGPYGLLSGTSMAAALVSGVAALALGEHPGWGVDQLRSRIGWTAQELELEDGLRILRADSLLIAGGRPDLALRVRGLADEDGNGLAEGGDVVDLRFDVAASFGSQVGVTVESWTDDPWLVPLVQTMVLPSVPNGTDLQVRRGIKYWVHPSTPPGYVAQISLRAVVAGVEGPPTSGAVTLRPLAASIEGDRFSATVSSNGVIGQATQVVSGVQTTPGFGRLGDPAGYLTKAALLLGDSRGRVSDAVMPRVSEFPYKDFVPLGAGLVRRPGSQQLALEYADRGAPETLRLRVEQSATLHEVEDSAFLLLDYEVHAFEQLVAGVRWGLALDFSIPAAEPTLDRGVVDERLVVTPGMRGLRVEAAEPGAGAGVAGVLLLGNATELGFSGLAQWAFGGEEGWNIPGSPGETVSDQVLERRMEPRVDQGSLDPVGDRVGIISGALGDVAVGESRSFAVAIAIAPDATTLEAILDRARVTWEAERVGLTPETLSDSLVRFSANPFRGQTEISFALSRSGPARVGVFDLRGRRVRTLVDEVRQAGVHDVAWDGRDARGADVASGVYLVRLETESGTSTERVTRVR